MSDPWPALRDRYQLVANLYRVRFPGEPVEPWLVDSGNPNTAVMLIDRLLARIEGRAPTVIRQGDPLTAPTKDDRAR